MLSIRNSYTPTRGKYAPTAKVLYFSILRVCRLQGAQLFWQTENGLTRRVVRRLFGAYYHVVGIFVIWLAGASHLQSKLPELPNLSNRKKTKLDIGPWVPPRLTPNAMRTLG
jgi:hypothetical protein